MPRPPQRHITVVWQPNAEPDPDALQRAFAMIFRRRSPEHRIPADNPQTSLTNPAGELEFQGKVP